MKLIKAFAVVVVGISLALTSCGKTAVMSSSYPSQPSTNNTAPASGQTRPQGAGAEVTVTTNTFTPGSITVAKGTTVKWVSHDGQAHTVTSIIPNLFNGLLEPSGSFVYTFNQTGDYEYYCLFNEQGVMLGVVHVQ